MDEQALIADYVLGELQGLDRARFERRMAQESDLREQVHSMRALVARLEGLGEEAWEHAAPADPPAAAAHAAGAGAAPARERARAPRARGALGFLRRPAFPLLAGAVALAAALAIVLGSGSSPPAHTVVLRALADAPSGSRALARVTGAESVQLTVEHLPPAGSGHYYELWLMTDTTHLRPVAAFEVDDAGGARLHVQLPVAARAYRYLNISLQQQGSSGRISARSLLRGDTAGA